MFILGNRATVKIAEKYVTKARLDELEKLYGKQIGKTAENGNMTFQKKIDGKTVTTGVKWNDKKIAEVHHEGDVISGKSKKLSYNNDGDIVEVSYSRQATNYRRNVKENLETGEVDIRTFDATPQTFTVTHSNIDSRGKITQTAKNVKVKGKSSPLDK